MNAGDGFPPGAREERRVYLRGTALAERFFHAKDEELSHADGWDVIFGDRFGRGVLNLDGVQHRACRKALLPLLGRAAASAHERRINDTLDRVMPTLPLGTPFDLHSFTTPLVFEIAAGAFAGLSPSEAHEMFELYNVLRIRDVELGTTDGDRDVRRIARARRRMRALLLTAVERLADVDGPVRRLRALPHPPPDEAIAGNIAILILAGYETTGYLTARLLWLLARHPAEQDAIRRESGDRMALPAERRESAPLLDESAPLLDAAASLLDKSAPLLDAAFAEAARLHPPLKYLPRRALTDLAFNGTRLPAGSEVFYAIGETQRDPDLFHEPHEFRPRRFRDGAHDRLAWTPFSAGRRVCAGIHLGTLGTKLITVRLLQELRLSAPPGPYIGDVCRNGATVEPESPLTVVFHQVHR
ncbi:cytochrome P450 [Actinomadura rudentiformis]|uniref:Cytochrome P450 n=1 Tax=Actinomadura rudentiformis TaxID=359158 RepID=A0A6H9Z8K7_9ACTN|nr:cytochrome P450 [Actinomadura rudentiformis]KAB2350256.1 cytochrome P450 [Actinomadura rudentiformis]